MTCLFCKQGNVRPGPVTVTLNRGESTIIIKSVPAEVCENCGEYYLENAMVGRVLSMAEDAVRKGAEVEILRFAA